MVEQMGKDLAKRKQELAAADELHAADTVPWLCMVVKYANVDMTVLRDMALEDCLFLYHMRAVLQVQMAKYEGEIHQLASQVHTCVLCPKNLASAEKITAQSLQLSALEIKQEQEVEMLKTKHEDQATSMRSKHEAEVASIKELQAEQLKMLQTNQQSQSTRMNEMQEAEIQQIQNQLSAEVSLSLPHDDKH